MKQSLLVLFQMTCEEERLLIISEGSFRAPDFIQYMVYYKADWLFQQPRYLCLTVASAELFARVCSVSPWPNSSSHVEVVRLQGQCVLAAL